MQSLSPSASRSSVRFSLTTEPDESHSPDGRGEAGLFIILANLLLWSCVVSMVAQIL